MRLLKKAHNYLFEFPPLKRVPGLTHAVVSRLGGVSRRLSTA
ncbi:hypothetical protein [Desulfosarcina cetonica]|nr:hypothetical protein [Desulfosarcina cetonica]